MSTKLESHNPTPTSSHPGVSLGIEVGNVSAVIKQLQKGLPYKAIVTLQKNTGIPLEQLAAILRIPPRTLARRKTESRFHTDESERLMRLGRVFEKSCDLFEGNVEAAKRWLDTPAKAFAGVTPFQMIETEIGAREVEELIIRLEHGVFS